MITVESEDPCAPDDAALLDELSEVLSVITGSSGKSSFNTDDVRVANARFVIARDEYGTALGCGAFRPLGSDIAIPAYLTSASMWEKKKPCVLRRNWQRIKRKLVPAKHSR